MSSPSNNNNNTMYTKEGLPLGPPPACVVGESSSSSAAAAVITTSDATDLQTTTRRVECRPPQLIASPLPIANHAKTAPSSPSSSVKEAIAVNKGHNDNNDAPSTLLTPGRIHTSLIDDDENEVVDYFSDGPSKITTPSSPTTATSTNSNTTTQLPSRWNVREHHIPTLPKNYPLEKSAIFIPQACATTIANRITSILKSKSIHGTVFDAPHAKVDCTSKSNVAFRIRLYRGRGEYSHGLIVEVQRRGDSFDLSYMYDVYAILDAAEGKIDIGSEDVGGNNYLGSAHSVYFSDEGDDSCSVSEDGGSVSSLEEDEDDMDSLECTGGLASLDVISDILCPRQEQEGEMSMEGRDFALSSLASLTSLDRVGQAAVKLSQELLYSRERASLRQVLFSHSIIKSDSASTQGPQRTMLQSLEVLANASTSTSTSHHTKLLNLLSLSKNEHEEPLLHHLVENIEHAQINPRAAHLSCVILKNAWCSPQEVYGIVVFRSKIQDRLLSAVIKAVSYGGECYGDLEQSSQLLLERIM